MESVMMRRAAWATIGLLLLPTATAFEVTLQGPTESLQPGTGLVTATITATATCEEVRERQVPTPASPIAPASSLAIDINLSASEGIAINGAMRLFLVTEACASEPQGNVSTNPMDYSISADPDVAGLVSHPFTITGRLEGGDFGEPVADDVSGSVFVDYHGALQFVVDQPIKVIQEGPGSVFTFTVTNVGNADTTVSMRLAAPPPNGLRIDVPGEFDVPYDPSGATNTLQVPVTVSIDPDATGEIIPLADLTIEMDSWATAAPTMAGPSGSQPLSVRIQDAKGAPAPTVLLVAPALLAAALLTRRGG